ncbi:MAG TPA: bifunctional ornithine acetyltransferase/N-acetylglutamate synthase, partial [Eubacteriales bacterium]|nr:bifunctional ornithine acetyltransferase/N-acetylglutamate synthase [Eubacteriales bacterium]
MDFISGGVCAPKGFKASGVHCGIRKNKSKRDLALIYSEAEAAAAAVYTKNLVKGAPILVTKKNLSDGRARAVICNSGNANTCNADGVEIAEAMCRLLADELKISPADVIVASTGVIGQPLPIEPIKNGIKPLVAALGNGNSALAAEAIMTTDTALKEVAATFEIDGKTCTVGGIAKGSGMINPNMATMLVFITTDAAITPEMLTLALKEDVKDSFNMISVDGDTSTNDMVSVMANGTAQNKLIDKKNAAYRKFKEALFE